MDTISSAWFRSKERWVAFVGIPYHLLSFKTMDVLCHSFGKVKEYANVGSIVGNFLGARVKMSNYVVKCVS